MAGTAKLIVLSEQVQTQKMYELSERIYTIGRTDDQKICLPDSTVSSQHCELIRNEDGSFNVQDLGSSNGTRINGVRITQQRLEHSDILQVGNIEILYHSEETSSAIGQSSPHTGINLENTENGIPINEMVNVNPFKKDKKKIDKKKVNLFITLSFALLIVVVLALAVYLIINFYR